jgi:uncharacterized protein (DUF58 family)
VIRHATGELFWSAGLLTAAVLLAVFSAVARNSNLPYAAATLAIIALSLAAYVSVAVLPSLRRRIPSEYLGPLQSFRLTPRGFFLGSLILALGVSTFYSGNNLLVLILSFLLASILVSGMVSNVVLHGLHVRLDLPRAIFSGQRVIALITIQNLKKHLPSFSLRFRGRHPRSSDRESTDFFAQATDFAYLPAGASATVRMESDFKKRGVYPVLGFEVSTRFPFGFFARSRKIDAEGKITVYPALTDLTGLIQRYPFLQGPDFANRKGWGAGLYNIRDYQRGDEARFIHWKATGKVSRLMVKELVREEDEFVHILFSAFLGEQQPEWLDKFENVLSVLTTLAHLYWNRGRRFTFSSGEFEAVLNGRREDFDALMDYLAWVQPSDKEHLDLRAVGEGSILFAAGEPIKSRNVQTINYLDI